MHSQTFSITAYLKFLLREYAFRTYYFLVLLATIGIFIFDLNSPLGIAAGTPYILVVFASLWIRSSLSTYIIAAIGLLFTLIGFYLSPINANLMETLIINRTLAVLLIVITTIMVLKIKQADASISALMIQTTTDPLTQSKNRRAFEQELNSEMLRDKRYNRNLSVAIIDIDHLKAINDVYGYGHGDDLIKKVKQEIEHNIRNSDSLYRLEGDQFAILFTETNMAEAKRVGEEIRQRITSEIEEDEKKITISIGIATLNTTDSKRNLCKRAEDALFISKRNGRNQVSTLPHIINQNKSPVAAILSRSSPG